MPTTTALLRRTAGSSPGTLRPVADEWEWQLHGACRTTGPELFFHPEGERGPSKRNRDLAAKEICATCPVLATCAAHALVYREPYGVWGGMSEEDREEVYAVIASRRDGTELVDLPLPEVVCLAG